VDVVVSQQLGVGAREQLARGDTGTMFDLYDPILFEALGFHGGRRAARPRLASCLRLRS
jgi:hypothetical protein